MGMVDALCQEEGVTTKDLCQFLELHPCNLDEKLKVALDQAPGPRWCFGLCKDEIFAGDLWPPSEQNVVTVPILSQTGIVLMVPQLLALCDS